MSEEGIIGNRVHHYYWDYDFNCATTMLKILAEIYDVEILEQIYDAAIGLPGAGRYGAQCGLVSGAIMFVGIYGKIKNISEEDIVKNCYAFTDNFNKKFGHLTCSELRPEGFRPENPPHLCENLTKGAVEFAVEYIKTLK